MVFSNTVDGEYAAMHHDVKPRGHEAHGEQAFRQILQTVAVFKTKLGHGSGEDDGYVDFGKILFKYSPVSTMVSVPCVTTRGALSASSPLNHPQ
jgi:hypothetical protein